jgi:hypothetical protein
MTRFRHLWVAVALLAAAGCRNNRSELVEAELRTRDRELRELRGELQQSTTMNEALENTLRAQQCNQPVSRPVTGFLSQIKDIQLGRGTGGIIEDKIPGDEGLMVVLVPRDSDGSPIKAAGTLKVTALQITPEGLKTPLSTWDVSSLQLRRSWKSGLFSTGYFVALPWQTPPMTEKLRIVATFMPLDGGTFEAEKDVTIKLLADAIRGPLPPPSGPSILGPPLPAATGPALPINNVPVGPPPRPAPPTDPAPATLPPATPTTESKRWQPVSPTVELGRPDGVESH